MAFKKEYNIYEQGRIRIYINQCLAVGFKTRIFSVRRDDTRGLGMFLGLIKWSGRWRQYVFITDKDTQWSNKCLLNICNFLEMINKEERSRWKRMRSS